MDECYEVFVCWVVFVVVECLVVGEYEQQCIEQVEDLGEVFDQCGIDGDEDVVQDQGDYDVDYQYFLLVFFGYCEVGYYDEEDEEVVD